MMLLKLVYTEAATRGVLSKKVFLKMSENSQVFSCEYCEALKNTFFTEHLRMTTCLYI